MTISSTHAGVPIDQLFIDLRRGVSAQLATRVRAAAPYLPPADREMLLAMIDQGQTAVALSRIAGRPPRQIRRIVRRAYRRINSPEFQFVLARVDAMGGMRRRVALACFLHGLSLRKAAAHLRLSVHLVRRHANAIRNQMELTRSVAPSQQAA